MSQIIDELLESNRAARLQVKLAKDAERFRKSAAFWTKRLDKIVAETAARHGVSSADIMGRSRRAPIVRARYEAIRRARFETELSYLQLGRYFGRDHSTIIHAMRSHPSRPPTVAELTARRLKELEDWPAQSAPRRRGRPRKRQLAAE